jgi:hypothetical protein
MPQGRPRKTPEEKKAVKREYMREYQKKRYADDPVYRENKILKSRINSFNNKKS